MLRGHLNQLWIKLSGKDKVVREDFFKYFKVEKDEDTLTAVADINDEDIKRWLYAVTTSIAKSFSKHPEIKNYLSSKIYIGGQLIEFSFVKEGKAGPHEMRMKLESEVERLKSIIKETGHEDRL